MQAIAIFGILLSITAVMVEGTCNIYQMTTIQLDFCNYAEVITDLVPGIVSTNQLQHCIANIEKDMCRPVNDCANSETLMAEALALLDDILNDNSCTDPCTSSPCAFGSCERLTSQTYSCECFHGYNGNNCQNDINECGSNPCQNGGICVDGMGSFTCSCSSGFEGQHCELNIDECEINPCQNGGICVDGIDSFTCTCSSGFEGTHCEFDIDECASAPCMNDGLCTDGIDQYSCTCNIGFSGLNCEQDVDECEVGSHMCENGGICDNFHGGYLCQCAPGFSGDHCEEDVDECVSGPCDNGGICENTHGEYQCQCAPGFNGAHCENDIDECESGPCHNGGFCDNNHGGYQCQCDPGFIGDHCEIDIDECGSAPCMNGGLCTDNINQYTCTCIPGFSGLNCEQDIDECASAPCMNGGVCKDDINQYTCTCMSGFSGLKCDHEDIIGSGPACYTKLDGSDYRGDESTTVSGFPCQAWVNTYPHHVSNLEHFLFHDQSNYCRNYPGSGKSAPWCYTGLEEFEWEYCENVPTPYDICNDKPAVEDYDTQKAEFDAIVDYDRNECYTDPQGLDYTGYIDHTVEGYQCQRWDVNYPNMRNDAKKSKPRHNSIIFGGHNYCRTDGNGPEGPTTGPWCWIADPAAGDKRWGYCDTASHFNRSCPGKGTPVEQPRLGIYPECMLTAPGPDYVGDVDVTETGLDCINWADLDGSNAASQMYKDVFSAVGNSCRYFGTTDPWKRPWCYTSQTETEKCRVKDHYDQCFPAL